MRIAVFTDTYLPEVNGVVTSIDSHSRMLGERGHEILVICPKYRKPILHVVPHVTIQRYRSFSFISNRDTRIALPTMASVAARLRAFKPDLVHIHTPLSIGVIGLATARMMRMPVVETYHTYLPDFMQYVELHRLLRLDDLQVRVQNSIVFERMFETGMFSGLARLEHGGKRAVDEINAMARAALGGLSPEEREQLSTRLAWQFTRTIYNRANLVLTPSQTLKDALESHGVTAPVEYLSNGIDVSLVTPKLSYASTGRLLHAGRLGHEKNVDVVLRAFARVAERLPGYTLDIIGDGPARPGLQRLASTLGIADRVKFRGFIERSALAKVYRDYDAFVTASTIETQGIVLLEAMAAGVPVVGVDALAIPEIVQNGRAGIIVPPGDDAAIAEALVRVLPDEALRASLGAGGREGVQPHALPAVVERLEELYARVSEATPRSR